MMAYNYEALANDRMRRMEEEIKLHALLSQIPRRPSVWQRWLGDSLVRSGNWMTNWGASLARRECEECVSS